MYTDHYSLQWLRAMKNESTLLHRWAAQLEDYDFKVLHRTGKNKGACGFVSRLPTDNIHLLGHGKVILATEEETREVLERIHQDRHLGIRKTLQDFRRRFEGVRDRMICQAVVSSCLGCQVGSDHRPRKVPQGQIESTSPWDILSIAVMGPFVSNRRGERYVLSIIDCFTKYLILVPLKDRTASTVSKALYERVIVDFGCPRKILSDRGTELAGRIWTDLMDLLWVQRVLTSPYYPQGNGIVECSHHAINNLLRSHMAGKDDGSWVDLLPGVMLIFNEMTGDHHGFTASQIFWGQSMNLPVDLVHGEPAKESRNTGGYVKKLQQRLQEIRRTVAPFNRRQEKKKENLFKVGELVLIFQQPMERDYKLSPKWRGPFPIIKIENPFQVCYDDRRREKIAHVRHCKKFKTSHDLW